MNRIEGSRAGFKRGPAWISMIVLLAALLPFRLAAQEQTDQIAFASNRDGDFEIYLMDLDGNVFAQLTDNDVNDLNPTWSPDGERIAFASNVDGDYDIYVTDIASSKSVNLTDNGWEDLYPAWSPDGSQIAFTTNRDRNWEIYLMDTGGGDPTRLTQQNVYDGNPSWSPDGSQIVYVVGRDKDREIWVMNADGSDTRQITDNNVADYGPVWSPDSSQNLIAFVSSGVGRRPDIPGIYTVDLACLDDETTTCDDSADNLTGFDGGVDPAWSLDGNQIVFASGRESTSTVANTELYVMDADGNNIRRLTNDPADDRFPAWWSPARS